MTNQPHAPSKSAVKQANRRRKLNAAAKELGFENWGKLETDVINKKVIIKIAKCDCYAPTNYSHLPECSLSQ